MIQPLPVGSCGRLNLSLPAFCGHIDYTGNGHDSQRSSNSIGLRYPLVECLFLIGLKNWSMYALTARRAWLCVANERLRKSSHSSVLKKLSVTALSWQSTLSLLLGCT